MSDTITATGSESKFKAHAEGQFVGQCVDTIDLGLKVQDYPGKPSYLAPTCALVYRTGEKNEETGDFIDIAKEFTVSMSDRANLRKHLEQWRGKPYTAEQIEAGVSLDKLTGNYGLLSIAQKTSGKGRIYANITACVGIPKQMLTAVTDYTTGPDKYTRADFWATKKAEYAATAAAFRGAATSPAPDEEQAPPHDDDDLPF